ncbi:hypothetical protein ABN028_19510 [Actinopolymorpha sp. B17G11]|uniref:hypothetical protein n=1 Tax=Actinopolymorpha sp. B17G11 TaxID=3160861 RepID=UPI0032E52680
MAVTTLTPILCDWCPLDTPTPATHSQTDTSGGFTTTNYACEAHRAQYLEPFEGSVGCGPAEPLAKPDTNVEYGVWDAGRGGLVSVGCFGYAEAVREVDHLVAHDSRPRDDLTIHRL